MSNHTLIFIVLPVVGAIIGATTKWLAIKLLFHPADRVALGPIGWQGVIQRRAPQMAHGVAETIGGAGLDIAELLARVDAAEIADVLAEHLAATDHALAESVADSVKAGLWSDLSTQQRLELVKAVHAETHRTLEQVIDDVAPWAADRLDMRAVLVDGLSGENANRLARVLEAVAKPHIRTMVVYGVVLGFAIGVVQAGFYSALEKWWLLPLIGALDGLVNNFLAIQMVFYPLERKRLFEILPIQGLIPSQRDRIASTYAQMLAEEVLTPANLGQRLVADGSVMELLPKVTEVVAERFATIASSLAVDGGVADVPAAATAVGGAVMAHLIQNLPAAGSEVGALLTKRLDIAATIELRLTSLESREFVGMLRGLIGDDEATLIAIGAALGATIGSIQAAIVIVAGLT